MAVFGRRDHEKGDTKAKKPFKFIYKTKFYKQHHIRDVYRVYPDLGISKDSQVKNLQDFETQVSKSDIVLVADSTLVDNFSYSFIELLLNFGLKQLSTKPNWNPAEDPDLQALVLDYARKMSNLNTVKAAFYMATGNPNFKSVAEDTSGKDLTKCELSHFFPALGANVMEKDKNVFAKGFDAVVNAGKVAINYFQKNCLRDIARARYFFESPVAAGAAGDDDIIKAFSAQKIGDMYLTATKLIQKLFANGIGEVTAEQFKAYLTYAKVIEWRTKMSVQLKQKDALKKAKKPLLSEMPLTQFDEMVAAGKVAPINGDVSLFANILQEGVPDLSDVSCTPITGKIDTDLPQELQDFYAKTLNSEELKDIETELELETKALGLGEDEFQEKVERRRIVL